MAKAITTSFVVSFSTDVEASIIAEVDDRPDGKHAGETNFSPGDDVYFLVFYPDNVTVDQIVTTAGSVSAEGTSTKEVEEMLQFANESTANVQYPINLSKGFNSTQWIGSTPSGGGGVLIVDQFTVKATGISSGFEFNADGSVDPNSIDIGILKVVYDSDCDVHKLTHSPLAGLDEYEIMVFVVGHAT